MRRMVSSCCRLLLLIPALASLSASGQSLRSQTPAACKPPINRQLYHDYVDREQRNALRSDGKADGQFTGSPNEEINYLVTQGLTASVDALQCRLEADSLSNHQKKVTYLRGLENLLKTYTGSLKSARQAAATLPSALEAYEAAVQRDLRGESVERLVERASYEVGHLVVSSNAFNGNAGYRSARYALVRKYATLHPERTFTLLKDNMDVPFRDSLIKVAAYKHPRLLYDYAAANNKLGNAIMAIDDPMIRTVGKMARSGGSGQLYFPFLDNILAGKQKIEEIDAVKNDDLRYFRLLVKTRIDYVQRVQAKETVYGFQPLEKMLEKRAREVFVKEINALHEEPDARRFRILQPLTPEELYYLIVYSESDIYTSSYTRGVYPLLMQKAGRRGDSLLLSVGFDRFKKFIKVAAAFNTLSDFLSTFPNGDQAQTLMTAFVNGLERSGGLEDGVDVADSYASISESIRPIAEDMLTNVRLNYERNAATGNRRGMVIYDLLYKLFRSADSTAGVDLSRDFGIPPVYNVSYASLASDSSERVVMQVFFYGDEDGRIYYSDYVRRFPSANWKRTETPQWVEFTSTRGKPVTVFANKPLDENKDLDAEAQAAMAAHIADRGLQPTIIIHRGHSYYAPYTIRQIPSSAKIVFLGSCGGFNLIHDVLELAPDAHIIASKQIGKGMINQPFFDLLTEKVRNGQNIDWIPFWNEFRQQVRVEGFDDYIPPHKNLGAIFIKAYKISMGEEE